MSCENHYVRFVSVLSSGAGDLAAKTCNVISSNYEKRQIPHLYLLNQRPKNSDHKDRLSEVFGNPVDCFEEALHQGRSYLFIDRQNARASEKEMLALKLPDHRFIY